MYIGNDKIYLREVRLLDLSQDYCDWLNDPEVNRYLETRFEIQTVDRIREYWEDHKDERWFAICLKDDSRSSLSKLNFVPFDMPIEMSTFRYFIRHIGNIKLGPINWIHSRADVSLVLKKEYWHKGYGSEAIKLISDYAFKALNICKLTAGIYDSNIGSRCAFAKAGFNREALLTKHVFSNGKFEDVLLMARFYDS